MDRLLTFIVPLRSPQASKNWENVLARLEDTAWSIQAACGPFENVRAILVANLKAELGSLPPCFEVLRVDIPPPDVSVFLGESPELKRSKAVRHDKGYKIASGMILAKRLGSRFVMSVDADDLISSDLAKIPFSSPDSFGWFINQGWLLPLHSSWGVLLPDFHNWCGSYAIIRIDLLPLAERVEDMDPVIVSDFLGHHRELIPAMVKAGTPLEPINYNAVVYLVDHSDNNYRRRNLSHDLLSLKKLLKDPRDYFKWLLRLRFFGRSRRDEFFGARNEPVFSKIKEW